MKKINKLAKTLIVVAMVCLLAACGKHSMSLELLDEASGVKVTAENAGKDDVVTSEGAITVEDGDVIVISPFLDKGSFKLTITNTDDGTVVYDDVAEGKVLFQIDAVPGTYTVEASGNGATGWMTVFAESADEIEEQDESLAEALEDVDIDESVLSDDGK